jgi:hypothetical protein
MFLDRTLISRQKFVVQFKAIGTDYVLERPDLKNLNIVRLDWSDSVDGQDRTLLNIHSMGSHDSRRLASSGIPVLYPLHAHKIDECFVSSWLLHHCPSSLRRTARLVSVSQSIKTDSDVLHPSHLHDGIIYLATINTPEDWKVNTAFKARMSPR